MLPEYNRQKIAVTFATSATTSVDTTLTEPNLVHSLLVIGHTWAVAGAEASAASGGVVSIIDVDGRVVKTFTEVLTGVTTLLSGDVMVFPNDVVRYALTVTDGAARCVSGTTATAADGTYNTPTATIVLYKY